MCEFCTKHGDGKKWYLRAENYSMELAERLKAKEVGRTFGSNFGKIMNHGKKTLRAIKKMPWFLQNFAFNIHEMWQKKMHYGQVIPIEDVEEILQRMSSIVLLPCLCRKYTANIEGDYCMGITLDPIKSDYAEALDQVFYGGPDLHGLSYITYDEAMELIRQFEKERLVHTVWTLKTPFVAAICNCDIHTCTAFQFKNENLRVMFRAEFVAVIDADKCTGCKACLSQCHFNALLYNDSLKKIFLDATKCYGCGICRVVCPNKAIELIDRRKHALAKDLWY